MYVTSILNRSQRSILTQFRCGILPVKIETGWFQDIPLEYCLYLFCDGDFLESETHFATLPNYANLRWDLFQLAQIFLPTFIFERDEVKRNMLLSDELVNTLQNIYTVTKLYLQLIINIMLRYAILL